MQKKRKKTTLVHCCVKCVGKNQEFRARISSKKTHKKNLTSKRQEHINRAQTVQHHGGVISESFLSVQTKNLASGSQSADTLKPRVDTHKHVYISYLG